MKKVKGESGGHPNAAGAIIQTERENEFIKLTIDEFKSKEH